MAEAVTTDEMSSGEVARRLEEVARETRDLAGRMLLREVYEARQEVVTTRLGQVEKAQAAAEADRVATRRLVVGGVIAFLGSTAVQIVTIVITLMVGGN